MNQFRALKYLLVYSIPVLAYVSFYSKGWLTFAPMLEAFVLIPVLELFFKPDEHNLSKAELELIKEDKLYDFLLYLIVPVVFFLGFHFCKTITEANLLPYERVGRITALGLCLGALGINVGHELGHRKAKFERFLAKTLLLSSFYMHFYIEHNRGHHRNVSTPNDPASARKGEWIIFFWVRSIVGSYFSAWQLEFERMKKRQIFLFSLKNEMVVFHAIQIAFAAIIFYFFGAYVLGMYLLAALMGILLLETVNYIEHYGLQRQQTEDGNFERVQPHHSWNSDHPIGRLMLFELSRHSDHHYIASQKYQVLKSYADVPHMPTGYPGMMVLALFPPLWFVVMHGQMRKLGIK